MNGTIPTPPTVKVELTEFELVMVRKMTEESIGAVQKEFQARRLLNALTPGAQDHMENVVAGLLHLRGVVRKGLDELAREKAQAAARIVVVETFPKKEGP